MGLNLSARPPSLLEFFSNLVELTSPLANSLNLLERVEVHSLAINIDTLSQRQYAAPDKVAQTGGRKLGGLAGSITIFPNTDHERRSRTEEEIRSFRRAAACLAICNFGGLVRLGRLVFLMCF